MVGLQANVKNKSKKKKRKEKSQFYISKVSSFSADAKTLVSWLGDQQSIDVLNHTPIGSYVE